MRVPWAKVQAELDRTGRLPASLARATQDTDQTVYNWKVRGFVPAAKVKAVADALGWTVDQLLDDNWPPKQHAPEGLEKSSVAHVLNQPEHSDVPLISWEGLMSRNLPKVFRVVLRDSALAPDLIAGDEIVVDRSERPRANDMILVRDRDGVFYARRYAERRAREWRALGAEGFDPLEVDRDGLEIVGTCIERRQKRR